MEIQDLSVSERIILAEKLWNSVVNHESEIDLTESQKLELDRRLEMFSEDNDEGSSWAEAKQRITSLK